MKKKTNSRKIMFWIISISLIGINLFLINSIGIFDFLLSGDILLVDKKLIFPIVLNFIGVLYLIIFGRLRK